MAKAAPAQRGWTLFGSAEQKLLSIFSGKDPDLVHWTGFDASIVAKSWPARERLATHIATFDPPTVLSLIDRLRTAERALGEVWQPIESAPRDGTHIILAFGQDAVCEGWYDDNGLEPRPWKFVDSGGPGSTALGFINASRDEKYGPSHRRPLPTPPVTP